MSVKYRVLIDNKDAYSPYDESLAIYNTTLELNQDDVSTFEFSVDRTHALINDIHPRNSAIEILRNGASIFRGIVYSVSTNYDGSKDIKCKDELYFLSLTIMEPFQFGSTETGKKIIINADGDEEEVDNTTETHVSVADYLNHLIKCHNMHSDEKFTVGIVTATGDGVFSDSSYTNTWSLISSAMETYGFHVRVRHENGVRYIDFLKDITDENPQTIEFSKNLTDAKVERDASEMVTAIIPTGASYETKQTITNQYGDEVEQTINNVTTIESVNGGVKYIYDADAVAKYGWSWKRFEYNTTDPSILLAKAKEELTDSVKHTLNITVDGLDMGYTDKDVSFFEIGKLVHVICNPDKINQNLAIGTPSLIFDTRDTVNTDCYKHSDGTIRYQTKKWYSLSNEFNNIKKGDTFTISYDVEIYKCSNFIRLGIEPYIKSVYYSGWTYYTTYDFANNNMTSPFKFHFYNTVVAKTDLENVTSQANIYFQGVTLEDGGYCLLKNLKIEKGVNNTKYIPAKEDKEYESQDEFIDGKYLCKKMSINLINPSDFKIELTASSLVEGDAKTARATSNNSVVTDLASSQRLFQQSLDGSQEEFVRRVINQDNEIGLSISNKTTKSEIIASINDIGQSEAKIKADKISLEGLTTINDGFSVDLNGNMTANNGTFNGVVNAESGYFGPFKLTNMYPAFPNAYQLVSHDANVDIELYKDSTNTHGTILSAQRIAMKTDNDYGYMEANCTFHSGSKNDFRSGWDGSHWGLSCTTDLYLTSTGTDKKVYTVNGPASTSDRKAKNIVSDGLDAYDFIMNLKPVKYTWKNGKKVHMGFIAQDVYAYLHSLGYDDYDIVNATNNNDSVDNVQEYDDKDLDWHMSYNDVIAPLVETVQRLSKEVEKLKEEIKNG